MTYSVRDLENPLIIYYCDAGDNVLEKAINNAFHDDHPYACLDDIPYVEYCPKSGEVEIDDTFYIVDQELQDYLKDVVHKLNTIPLPKIRLREVELEMIHPDEDDENAKGLIKIARYRPLVDPEPLQEPSLQDKLNNARGRLGDLARYLEKQSVNPEDEKETHDRIDEIYQILLGA